MSGDVKVILSAAGSLLNARDFLVSAANRWDSTRHREINSAIDNLRDGAELLGFDLVSRETVRPLTVTTDDRAADGYQEYR